MPACQQAGKHQARQFLLPKHRGIQRREQLKSQTLMVREI